MKINKTNAMRFLDTKKITYSTYTYEVDENHLDGISVANQLNQDIQFVYKTLVTRGQSKQIYVFVINVADELDLKACAKAVHEKNIEMIHVNELLGLTGYIRGGCSPIGMKKNYPTIISSTAKDLDSFIFSGGKRGLQIECNPLELAQHIRAEFKEIIKEK